MEIKTKLMRLRPRAATDQSGRRLQLVEWRELVSVNGSPWEPRNGHGEYMTLDGTVLDRISSLQWEGGEPHLVLTLQD